MPTPQRYEEQLAALLPRGLVWPTGPDSIFRRLLRAVGTGLAAVHTRVLELLVEADPRTTTELLTDWERVLDIPGPCDDLAETIQRRREVATQKLSAVGGAAPQYWIDLALQIGDYVVTITEPRPFVWQVNAPAELATFFRAGEGVAGDPLAAYGALELACFFEQFAPAHTTVLFDFGS